MSRQSIEKIQRRVKRQTKKRLAKLYREEKDTWLWKEFLGIKEQTTYYPSEDPKTSNHKRVVASRLMSGRLDPTYMRRSIDENEARNSSGEIQ